MSYHTSGLPWLAIRAIYGDPHAAGLVKAQGAEGEKALRIAEHLRAEWRAKCNWIRFSAPPVYSGNWDESDWLRYVCTDSNWNQAEAREAQKGGAS